MHCTHCGNEVNPHSISCASCGVSTDARAAAITCNRIVRPQSQAMAGGVCAGVAIHYGWDVQMVRMTFAVLTCLTTGAALFFYLAAWMILPSAAFALPPNSRFSGRFDDWSAF